MAANRLFWGDLHCHVREWRRDRLSSGPGGAAAPFTLAEVYEFARVSSGLDFAAVTDHDIHLDDGEWADTVQAARQQSRPGRFVAFLGYEWSHVPGGSAAAYGHRNVIYRGFAGPLLRCNEPHSDTAPKLWAALRAAVAPRDVVVIPHHPARAASSLWWNLDCWDPELERLVEVYSLWGSSEKAGTPYEIRYLAESSPTGKGEAPGHFVQDALARGYRFGLIAGSESHDGRPGNPGQHGPYLCGGDVCYRGGIQGTYAAALEREALFDAFRQRCCYGTTGAKIVLEFTLNGRPMGAAVPAVAEREICVRCAGTDTICRVDIVRNLEDVNSVGPDRAEYALTWHDRRRSADRDSYYLRVTQVDGQMAWSSPIWVG